MAFIIDERVIRKVIVHVRVTVFQKRRLSHAQCIFFTTPVPKVNLLSPIFADTLILAVIPNAQQSLLNQDVLKHNMNHLCGHLNPSAVCIPGKTSSKHFLKDFVDETGQDEA